MKTKKMSKKGRLLMVSVIIFAMLLPLTVFGGGAQEEGGVDNYPERPIKCIVPFGAGGGSDMYIRMIIPALEKELDTDIVVENHPGAGSQKGLTILANAEPDGYTFGTANQINTTYTILNQEAPYKINDFAWLNLHMLDPVTFSVLKESQWNDLKELVDYIKDNPGDVNFGTISTSGNYAALLKLKEELNLEFVIVPYDGSSFAKSALVGGHIDVLVAPSFSTSSLLGKIKVIGIGSEKRSSLYPDSPTVAELFNNEELVDFVESMASMKFPLFPIGVKENYPERYEKFVAAYKKAFSSDMFLEDVKKADFEPVLAPWSGPDEAQKTSNKVHELLKKNPQYISTE